MASGHFIKSSYVKGTDGRINFFYRPKGQRFVYIIGDEEINEKQLEDEYIIQWGGSPEFDSGYSKEVFTTREEGLKVWKVYIQHQMGVDIIDTTKLGWVETDVFPKTEATEKEEEN